MRKTTMHKFLVPIRVTQLGFVPVEAESQDDAIAKVEALDFNPSEIMDPQVESVACVGLPLYNGEV